MLRIKQHKFIWVGIIVLGFILIGIPPLYAGDTEPSPADVAFETAVRYRMAALDEIAANREAFIEELVSKWFMDFPGWEEEFRSELDLANDRKLLAVSEAGSYAEVQAILFGGTPDDYSPDSLATPFVLGDTDKDLVYTPINPCRIIDTRKAGGPIGSNSYRTFYVRGANLSAQGGNPAGCISPRGSPEAVHMNIVAVNSTANGYLTVWPFNTPRPLANVLNYSPTAKTDPISNAFTVKSSTGTGVDINVYALKQTHVVADVMGYYNEVDEDDYKVRFAGKRILEKTYINKIVGCTNVTNGQLSIYVPGSGKITVTAQAWLNLWGHTIHQGDYGYLNIGASATDCSYDDNSGGYSMMGWQEPMDHPSWTGNKWWAIPLSRTFTVTSAGTKTYYLNSQRGGGTSTIQFYRGAMQAIYYPDF
jgi:hypothetical protein